MRGAGILTGCPSPTAFALGLGPALPWEDKPCPGNLGFSAETILTSLYATHTDIRTSDISTAPHGYRFTDLRNAPLPRAPNGTHPQLRCMA